MIRHTPLLRFSRALMLNSFRFCDGKLTEAHTNSLKGKSEANRLEVIEMSKKHFPLIGQYNPQVQVRLLNIFSQYQLKDDEYLKTA